MNETRTRPVPRTAPPSAAPRRAPAPNPRTTPAPMPLHTPTWGQRILPPTARRALTGLGWWHNPTPQPPSTHLEQTIAVLEKYGWCQSLDVNATGRLCIRGAQNLLEKTGHVTPAARQRAVHYMQHTLAHSGITMQFFTWNDLPGQQFPQVRTLLACSAHTARKNGE